VYFGKRSKKWVALVDGKETGPEMDGWWTHRWRSEGAALAVAAVLDGKSTWVIDGAAGPLFDVISDITFSRNGQHYAYGGAEAAAGFTKQQVLGSMVVDGKVLEPIFDVPAIVSYISRFVTLEPGDVIYTGTPGTTKAMKPGDVVEVEIEGVGVLRNRVERAK
jgi:hypothetical protein